MKARSRHHDKESSKKNQKSETVKRERRPRKIPNLVDVGTQTDVLMEDTMIIIMPSGTFFKLDGATGSPKRTEEVSEDSDWSSELLANASVTTLPLEDEVISRRDRISTDDDSGIQTKSIAMFSHRSSASSMQSMSPIGRLTAAPPGFAGCNTPDDSFIPEDSEQPDPKVEPLTEKMPKAKDSNRTFDIWRGQSIGLGERLVDLLTSGDVSELCDEDDCVIF